STLRSVVSSLSSAHPPALPLRWLPPPPDEPVLPEPLLFTDAPGPPEAPPPPPDAPPPRPRPPPPPPPRAPSPPPPAPPPPLGGLLSKNDREGPPPGVRASRAPERAMAVEVSDVDSNMVMAGEVTAANRPQVFRNSRRSSASLSRVLINPPRFNFR